MQMKKIAIRLVVLPIAAICTVLALANRGPVEISLWPLPWAARVPLFVALLAAVFVGALLGAAIVWLGQRRHRAAAREGRRESERLRRQLGAAKSAAMTPAPIHPPLATNAPPLSAPPR